ncbi:hypothetical protein DL765_005504 [Monosporascus sp. GIB2]|nr:hypothetical protein DL765_005504 [Monosporascus sp. GIB2]
MHMEIFRPPKKGQLFKVGVGTCNTYGDPDAKLGAAVNAALAMGARVIAMGRNEAVLAELKGSSPKPDRNGNYQ